MKNDNVIHIKAITNRAKLKQQGDFIYFQNRMLAERLIENNVCEKDANDHFLNND